MSITKVERQGKLYCPYCNGEQEDAVAEDYKVLSSWAKFEKDVVECEDCYEEFTVNLSSCEKYILVEK